MSKMIRALSHPILTLKKYRDENDDREIAEEEENEEFFVLKGGGENENEIHDLTDRVKCMTLHSQKRHSAKRGSLSEALFPAGVPVGEEISLEKYGLWRQEQKSTAARLEKQLKARWALDELMDEQLNRYHAHYNQAMVPTRLKDVAQLIMPTWVPPLEMASLGWLGDWRPSSVLELLRSLARSNSSLVASSSSSPESIAEIDRLLSQLIHEIWVEETVLDEEMAEIQATCILHLPFAPMNRTNGSELASVQSEFKKIERVIVKAQQLRFKALELVVRKVLSPADAAEFLVAFTGIQDSIHQFATQHRLQKGPVSVPTKAFGTI